MSEGCENPLCKLLFKVTEERGAGSVPIVAG